MQIAIEQKSDSNSYFRYSRQLKLIGNEGQQKLKQASVFIAGISWEPLGFPVLGATSGIAGCLAAIEVIKGITGVGMLYLNKMHRYDTLSLRSYTISLNRNSSCLCCAEKEGESHG